MWAYMAYALVTVSLIIFTWGDFKNVVASTLMALGIEWYMFYLKQDN